MSAGPHISDEQIIEIIDRVADGVSLKQACSETGFHYGNITRRIRESETLSALDARAREDYQRIRVDEMDDIARTVEDVQRARLICDNIKWEAARVARKVYGDRVTQEHTGAEGGPIQIANTIDRPPSETREEWIARRQRELDQTRLLMVSTAGTAD